MLELQDISLTIGEHSLLQDVSARFPRGHFIAVLGPSGCGKSTLLKVVAGLRESTGGITCWNGRDLAENDFKPHEIGYVPQFSIAYEFLTVRENIMAALRLRVAGLDRSQQDERVERILNEIGLNEIPDRQVHLLSGGQRRRLALGLEMVSAPKLLLADEVTTGLDPKAENEIVRLMQQIAHEDNCTVLSVTHSLRHMSLYDSVVALYEGRVVYHGPPEFLCHYFSIETPEELYPRLAKRRGEEWQRSWQKHHDAYYAAQHDAYQEVARAEDEPVSEIAAAPAEEPEPEREQAQERTPGAASQFFTLVRRRWRIFLRDRTQLFLQLALLFGFPCLVVIFAWDGLPQIQNLSAEASRTVVEQIVEEAQFMMRASRIASLVSGLVMFQVILLTLMGSNNSAREIAGERLIFEKEKFAGLRPSSYVASKAAFLAVLVLAQSAWMALFVKVICRFPGPLLTQIALLIMVNAALTAVCLAISSFMRTAEQASLVSVYLVGFQLPLSGAVLALPDTLAWVSRPFIAAYWSWSGFLQTMRESRFYDIVQQVTETPLAPVALCLWVLASHTAIGFFLAYTGCKSSRWE